MPLRIVEVGPRDGLQNEKLPVATEIKLRFIQALYASGLQNIEATSFVSPKWVPQLADADTLWPLLPEGPSYSALVPNRRGLERALAVGVGRIALFTAASEAFVQRNLNTSIEGSLAEFAVVVDAFRRATPGGWVRGYVSTAFECPYSGRVSASEVVSVVERLLALGVDEISLGDTIGVAGPGDVRSLTGPILSVAPATKLAYHFHDTNGTAIANVSAALSKGIEAFDASAGGLGGCPFAPGAGGNLATEDLVYLAKREGLATGVDLEALSRSSLEILQVLGRQPVAKAQVAALGRANAGPCAN
jgi:hydroxymethylglutaryl-CoA lyase